MLSQARTAAMPLCRVGYKDLSRAFVSQLKAMRSIFSAMFLGQETKCKVAPLGLGALNPICE